MYLQKKKRRTLHRIASEGILVIKGITSMIVHSRCVKVLVAHPAPMGAAGARDVIAAAVLLGGLSALWAIFRV